jgi:D-xylose transport system permease protein
MNLTTSTHSGSSHGGNGSTGAPTEGVSAMSQHQATDWRRLLSLREMGVYYALI